MNPMPNSSTGKSGIEMITLGKAQYWAPPINGITGTGARYQSAIFRILAWPCMPSGCSYFTLVR